MAKRIAVLLVAVVMAMVPVAALAQSAEADALQAALDQLDSAETVEEFVAAKDAVAAAADALKATNPDLDIEALQSELANLTTAIDGGDLDEIGGAAVAVSSAGAAAIAAAGGGDGDDGDDGDDDDGTETPTAVSTGSAVSDSPNVALLAVAGILMLLSVGAFAIRQKASQR